MSSSSEARHTTVDLNQALPSLSEEMISRMIPSGHIERVTRGTDLTRPGDRKRDFYVILDGLFDFIEDHDGVDVTFAAAGPGQFTGEICNVCDRPTLMGARARETSRILRIERVALRRLLAADREIGELLMRTFIHRRMSLTRKSVAVTTPGTALEPGSHVIRTFLVMAANALIIVVGGAPTVDWFADAACTVCG